MLELLNSGKRKRPSTTPPELIHLRFDELPFHEESGRTTEVRGISMVPGAWEGGYRPTASNGWVRTVMEPRDFTQAFTLEFFARKAPGIPVALNQYCGIIYDEAAANGIGIQYYQNQFYVYDGSGSFKWRGGNNLLSVDGDYVHHALVFNAGTYRFFRAGALLATFTGINPMSKTANLRFYMGGHPTLSISGTSIDFDEFLLSPGVAKYLTAFTPPDRPFYR